MSWPGLGLWMVEFPVDWFTGFVDAAVYMEMLKTIVAAVSGSISQTVFVQTRLGKRIGSKKTGQAFTVRPRCWTF